MKTLTDRNGNEIKVGHELNVPLESFANGIVILNEDSELSLELRYDSKIIIPIKKLNSELFKHLEIVHTEKYN